MIGQTFSGGACTSARASTRGTERPATSCVVTSTSPASSRRASSPPTSSASASGGATSAARNRAVEILISKAPSEFQKGKDDGSLVGRGFRADPRERERDRSGHRDAERRFHEKEHPVERVRREETG